MGPIDALDGGRIAIVADPAGAHFGVWQLGSHRGAELVNDAGAWSWAQLLTSDQEGAKRFYGAVFGWEREAFGEGPDAVTMWKLPGYVVDDVDEAVAWAIERGGHAAVPPFNSDFFRQAVLVDPAGAAFSVSKVNAEGR